MKLGIFATECMIKGQAHQLAFIVVKTNQKPLLSGYTCECLRPIKFMIPADVHTVEHTYSRALTKERGCV